MTGKSPDTVKITAERLKAAREWMTPERLAALDAMTDEDIAEQIADNPDAAPELDKDWFDNARLVLPMKAKKGAAEIVDIWEAMGAREARRPDRAGNEDGDTSKKGAA